MQCVRLVPAWNFSARCGNSPPSIRRWPKLRVGVNSGEALVRELGGPGYVEYAVVGDTINVGSRLEGQAPIGGVLIGSDTYRRLPPGAHVEPRPGLA